MMKEYTKEKMIMKNTEGNKNVSSHLALITALKNIRNTLISYKALEEKRRIKYSLFMDQL